MNFFTKQISYLFIMLLLTGITACGGGGGGSAASDPGESLKVSGKLGAGYSTSKSALSRTGSKFLADAFVDTVVALPIEAPFVASPDIMTNAVTSSVNADGSFDISIDTTRNWILLLIDSTQEKKNQIVSFAALGDSTGADSMILIPAANAVSNIDMGTLAKSGDEGYQSGTMTENLTNFSLNMSQLQQIAKNDNILKTIKNIYINYDKNTGKFYSLLLPFWWDADAKLVKNIFSKPENYTFSGYQPHFNSRNDTVFTYAGVKNKDYYVTVTPPAEIHDTNSYSYTNISSEGCTLIDEDRGNGARCLYSNTPPFAFSVGSEGWIQIAASGNRFTNIVEGMWLLKKTALDDTETEVAAFDLGVCSPISSVTNMPYVYLPSLKINVDASDNVISFEIKWYLYNAASAKYEEVTDISGFENLMEWVGLSFNDWEKPGNNGICDFNSVTDKIIYPKGSWKFTGIPYPPGYTSGDGRAFDIGSLRLGYRMYGVDFQVDFRSKL